LHGRIIRDRGQSRQAIPDGGVSGYNHALDLPAQHIGSNAMFCRLLVCLATCIAAPAAFAENNWQRFRGSNRSGVSESQNPTGQTEVSGTESRFGS
jgi:hypothetical protein